MNAPNIISENDFSLLVSNFPYTATDYNNRPIDIKIDSNAVKSTAAKCHIVIRLLGLIIGPKILSNDEAWEIYIVFRAMIEIIFSFTIKPNQIVKLKQLVKRFHELYVYLGVHNPMKPKCHYLYHYAEELERFGPLQLTASMRFEAKHLFFKKSFDKSNNRKSLTKNLSIKHQLMVSYVEQCGLEKKSDFLLSKIRSLNEIEKTKYFSCIKMGLQIDMAHVDASFYDILTLDNFVIKRGMVFPVRSTPNEVSLFGYVESFFKYDEMSHMIFRVITGVKFIKHYYSYELTELDIRLQNDHILGVKQVKSGHLDLFEFTPIYNIENKWYCSLKRTTTATF